MPVSRAALAILLLALAPLNASADEDIASPTPVALRLQPETVSLQHPRFPHSVLVSGVAADGQVFDLTSQATLTSADPNVVRVDALGWLHAVGNGQTNVTVSVGGLTATMPVAAALPAAVPAYSFRHEVMPVLSKGGCNQGACHGYSLGKNGFKLSLRGGDEAADWRSIAQEFLGRRINVPQPTASLLLTKPLGELPHGGGVRMEPDDLLTQTLTGWIADGAPQDSAEATRLEEVSVYPERLVTGPGGQQQLQVLARYSDGAVRDVTPLAVFTSNAELVAAVDGAGLIAADKLGETAIVVRFERMFDVCNCVVLESRPDFALSPVPTDNLVDQHVLTKLNEIQIPPSDIATDAEFMRRVFIDLIGVQPTPAEARAFLADAAPDKRALLIETLFTRPEFIDHWSLKWGDLLQNSRTRLSEESMWAFREWIRDAVASNLPWDEFARRLLTASGDFRNQPASAFYLISIDENDTLQRVAQVFCGVRMLCAKCHNHPFENWTQADYYGLASFFNQVQAKQDPLLATNGKARVVSLNLDRPFAVNPRSGGAQPPRYLGGGEAEGPANADRRQAFARWLTSTENPLFARSAANRVWSYFFHRGIIDPVDDLRNTNPPVNPALLDALSADLVANGYDLRKLMRQIVNSRAYQRAGRPNAGNAHDELNFSWAVPRRLQAEVLLDCLVQATDVPEAFGDAPPGFTAARLPDGNASSELLSLFGKPQRMESCECERSSASNMLQALQLINGKSILSRVAQPGARLDRLLAEKPADADLVEELYLWSLARLPDEAERQLAQAHFQAYGAPARKDAAQDLMWALLNSKDFLFNH